VLTSEAALGRRIALRSDEPPICPGKAPVADLPARGRELQDRAVADGQRWAVRERRPARGSAVLDEVRLGGRDRLAAADHGSDLPATGQAEGDLWRRWGNDLQLPVRLERRATLEVKVRADDDPPEPDDRDRDPVLLDEDGVVARVEGRARPHGLRLL